MPLAAVSRCSELSYETGQWSIRGLRPKSKTVRGDTLHTARDAPLCRIDPEQSPNTCVPPEHKPMRREREMIDLPAVEELKQPAKIQAVVRASDLPVVQTHAAVYFGSNLTSGQ